MALLALMHAQANLVAAVNVPAPAGTAAPVFAAALQLASAPAPVPKTEVASTPVAKAPRRQAARAAPPAHAPSMSGADVLATAPQEPPFVGGNAFASDQPQAKRLPAPSSLPAAPGGDDLTVPVPAGDNAPLSQAPTSASSALTPPPAAAVAPPGDRLRIAAPTRRRAASAGATPDATPAIAAPLAVTAPPGVRPAAAAPSSALPANPGAQATQSAETGPPTPHALAPPEPDKSTTASPVETAGAARQATPHVALLDALPSGPVPAGAVVAMPAIAAAPAPPPHAAAPVAPAPASPVEQVAASVRVAVAGAAQHVTVTLAPRDLGTVEIHVARQGDGPATVALSVERPETLALLRRDAPALQSALDRAGVPVAPQHVTMTLAPQDAPALGAGTQGDPRAPSHRPDPPRAAAPQHAAPAAADSPIPVPAQARTGIDITA